MTSAISVISSKRASFIGLGRLGLCTALKFEQAGWDILGVDIFPGYVDSINSKTLKSSEPGVEEALVLSSNLRATLSLAETLNHSDILFILVATPTGIGEQAYDTGTLSKVLCDIAALNPKNKHIVICCTVLPGFISNIASFILEQCHGCTITYNPEFIAQGEIMKGLSEPDLVLIGEGSRDAGDVLQYMYENATTNSPRICRMSPSSAEIMKLSLNCFVTTKISFANMVGDIADATPGANKFDILSAIGSDSRVGNKCIMPGFGFGGPCFPRDNRALGVYAKMLGIQPLICEATDGYNKLHAHVMAQNLLKENLHHYTICDVAYKSKCPVDIIEESQPLLVAKIIAQTGKSVTVKDRGSIISLVKRTFGRLFEYEEEHEIKGEEIRTVNTDMGNPLSSYSK